VQAGHVLPQVALFMPLLLLVMFPFLLLIVR
jgi:hypothetical protein